jgi:hypothetical protein
MSRPPTSCPQPLLPAASQTGSGTPLTVVAVCRGHRCDALLRLRDDGALDGLRQAVQASSRAVLVVAQCLQRCADGPVVIVGEGHTDQQRLHIAPQQLIAPASADHLRALVRTLGGAEGQPAPDGGTTAS